MVKSIYQIAMEFTLDWERVTPTGVEATRFPKGTDKTSREDLANILSRRRPVKGLDHVVYNNSRGRREGDRRLFFPVRTLIGLDPSHLLWALYNYSEFTDNPVIIGGGTFSGHPISMIAGLKTLEILKNSQQDYHRINHEGDRLLNNLNQYFKDEKLPIVASGHKSIIMLHILTEWVEEPSVKEITNYTDKKREALLHLALFNRNVLGLHGLGSISMAHTNENLLKIREVIEEISQSVSQAKF